MRRPSFALLLAATLAASPLAAAPREIGDWRLSAHSTATPGAVQCSAALKDEAGAVLALFGPGDVAGPRLTLTLAPALRDTIPLPDGPLSLAFRAAGQPAILLDGQIAPLGPLFEFTHSFASAEEALTFGRATASGRLTVFHPEAGVIARFTTAEAAPAMQALARCTPATEAPPDE
ncbi:hypothetical protein [Oceanicola sp. 502str15]|uniref:hypothetical protein n=1 Tax=Oceanicola sp. 502str15 TaxID=2696061 RepID=UPI0020944D81|nr:hypothetical protein [Oceanicola sp. 502str15]MCO6382160.1 hypothetical protein [Oceanicola sp. 502str15]